MKKLTNKRIAFIICVCICFGLCVGTRTNKDPVKVHAYTERQGVLTATNVNVRSGPGTEYGKVGMVTKGQEVTVKGEATATTGNLWYQVSFTQNGSTKEGYIYATYVSLTGTGLGSVDAGADSAFEAYLDSQSFPESYRKSLRALHQLHPNWTFVAQHTGLEWSKVVAAESKVGVNLVPSGSLDSWKSLESGAYNWDTGEWYGLDTSSWVAASTEIIQYFLDPRNFLVDDARILQFEALDYLEGVQQKSGVASILANSFMANENYYRIFMEAGQSSGVSPYHLAGRSLQEVSYSGSNSTSGKYPGFEGYYNFFNIGATPGGNGAMYNGMVRAKAMGWTSPELSIKGGASILGTYYIKKGQNTLYLQKFDVVDGGNGYYSHQYMTNLQAPTSEAKLLKKAHTDMGNEKITFYIPVYNNMPETAAVQPTSTGNPNNLLKSLSVDGYSLTPYFNKFGYSYSIVVPNSVSSVTIHAEPIVSSSSVSGSGTVNLSEGNNTKTITCTSQSGEARTYTITIARQGSTNTEVTVGDAKFKSSYTIQDGRVSGIALGTSAESFKSGWTLENCTIQVVDKNDNENNGSLATGNKVKVVQNGNVLSEYQIVLYGDVNGDGVVDTLDLAYLKRHILGVRSLSDAYATAGDVNRGNDGVDSLDLAYLKRHILGIKSINQ